MKQEKYNISIERSLLRLNSKGKKSNLSFPKSFGNKEKNNFITSNEKENILQIKTPICANIAEAYNKFEEITNVVYVELYNLKEIIWAFSDYEDEKLNIKINFSFDKVFYDEIKKSNKALSKIGNVYQKIKDNFSKSSYILENTYGKCKIKVSKTGLQIYDIRINHLTKNGLTENDVLFFVAVIFGCLEETASSSISEELKRLSKISKTYHLKAESAIQEIGAEIKAKKSRIQKENMSFEEKINLSKEYMEQGYNTRYCLQKYNKMASESIVLIKDAISQGINYKVLNEAKSVVELDYNGKKEFVIEGNKTDRDSYIFPIITDDKFIAKQVMKDAGLCVPDAILLEKDMDKEDIENLISPFYNTALVVKPRNTNYGTGITVFSKKASKKQILDAIEYAFKFDTNILIEEYAKGMEYRFLVVDGKCLSVAHRRIASVVGDGKSTIRQLIEEKNKEPWHFLTATPVKMDEPVVEYLKLQGYDFDTVIKKGKRVFLRTNSNCSTGGESIDMTDVIPTKFKRIAEKAAKAFDGKICGVDIIIEDLKADKYAIIEINDNPGYSINEWPYEGKGEKIGISILKLLDLVQA